MIVVWDRKEEGGEKTKNRGRWDLKGRDGRG